MRDMKWHIVDEDNNLLCWENDNWGKVNTPLNLIPKKKQKEFMKLALLNYSDFGMNEVHIINAILFYDGGYVSSARVIELMME